MRESNAAPPPSQPPGYRTYDSGPLGFHIALAPGWEEAGAADESGANFTDPSKQGVMLVHFEQAAAPDLDAAAAVIMTELTGGSGAGGASQQAVRLAGLPARRVMGSFQAGGATQQIDALVTVEGGRVWAVVLAGPPERVTADRSDFETMATTFRLGAVRPSAPARVALGLVAPGFKELDRIKGPVVLNFFATWCGPCRQEMPLLAERARRASGRFTVLAVNTRDDPAAVPGFLKELGVDFPVAYDRDGKLGEAYQLIGVPQTFFLDGKHVVRDSPIGPLSPDTLDQGLRKAGV